MRIDIVVVHVPRYRWGHEVDFVPPLTGIHLAALTPPGHQVRVIHQQVQPVDLETDADLVALSFFSGFAGEAFALARSCARGVGWWLRAARDVLPRAGRRVLRQRGGGQASPPPPPGH